MLPVLLLQACAQQGNTPNLRVKQQLDVIDSLYYDGHGDSSDVLLNKLRSQISTADPLISTYYSIDCQRLIRHDLMQIAIIRIKL